MIVSDWRVRAHRKKLRVTHVHLSAPVGVDHLRLGMSVRLLKEEFFRPTDVVREFSRLPWGEFDADIDETLDDGEGLRLETSAPGVLLCEWTVELLEPETPMVSPFSNFEFLDAAVASVPLALDARLREEEKQVLREERRLAKLARELAREKKPPTPAPPKPSRKIRLK